MNRSIYQDIATRVVRDYRKRKRELPWRDKGNPYGVWISEIMLQQTRIAAVVPYYERWLARFPGIEELAAAELDDVLAQWSGLGYYSRARNIHSCAKELAANYGAQLPSSAAELRKLPGIGPYTAGAISSIAYGQREALVDGNVARILSRLFAIDQDIKSSHAMKRCWQLCAEMVPTNAPGDFNQGLMELGSLVCTPRNPKCNACPVREFCEAYAQGRVAHLPVLRKRVKDCDKPLLETHALLLRRRGKLLLAQRPPTGLYGGLWELPQSEARAGLTGLTGLALAFAKETTLVHEQVLSHRRLKIHVWPAAASGATRPDLDSQYQQLSWYTLAELSKLGLSSATQAILKRSSEIQHGPQGKDRSRAL